MGGQHHLTRRLERCRWSHLGLAEGGYVSGPTNALVGEGGEPEYIIPESKMRESMARYSRGARGGSVILKVEQVALAKMVHCSYRTN